jgi:hypothetical protein
MRHAVQSTRADTHRRRNGLRGALDRRVIAVDGFNVLGRKAKQRGKVHVCASACTAGYKEEDVQGLSTHTVLSESP